MKLPNVGLASIAAVLEKAGIIVEVIDANAEGISLDEVVERIKKIKPNIVGSGGQTPISHLSLDIFKRTKKEVNKNIVTLAGGPHFSFTDEESLQNEVDPLTCPKCQGSMKIIAFIEREDLIKKILKHLGLWLARTQPGEVKCRPPPKIHSPPAELYADYSDSQIPPWDDGYSDPDYPFEAYM